MSIPERSDSSRRVLIADDSPAQAQLLSRILQDEGYHVLRAPNGREALQLARREKPLLVVSDVMLPEMNGYELCARIKNDHELANVPVILVTSLPDPLDVIRGLECRADNFLLKPFDSAQLLQRIQAVLADGQVRRTEPPGRNLELLFSGQKHFITADRLQILHLLLSSYETATQRIRALEQSTEASRQPRYANLAAAATSHAASTGRRTDPVFTSRSLRVLLIDDDPALLESLRSALQDEGHKVSTASGGQAGIDAFRESQRNGRLFDIVITDLGMPYVDGRQVVTSVRGMSAGTPIILLTGWGQHVVNDQNKPPQVDRLLGKPPRIRELRTALAELTGRRATDRVG